MPRAIYSVKAEFFKALGNPARIRILELLREGEKSAGELVRDLELEQSNVSQQLGVLRSKGIIEGRRVGATVFYRVKDPRTFQLLAAAKEIITSTLTQTNELLTDLKGIQFVAPKRSRR